MPSKGEKTGKKSEKSGEEGMQKVTAKTEPCVTYKNKKYLKILLSGTKGREFHDLKTVFGKF